MDVSSGGEGRELRGTNWKGLDDVVSLMPPHHHLTCSRDEGCKGSERIKHLVPRDEGPTEEALVVVWWH
jgi:hypothetical protein